MLGFSRQFDAQIVSEPKLEAVVSKFLNRFVWLINTTKDAAVGFERCDVALPPLRAVQRFKVEL